MKPRRRTRPFRKVLIANRGEIACRIIRTCRRMRIRTVAVFSEADRGALHAETADEAVAIGPAPASQSYLRFASILQAAHATKADAIHPGYGFLSENAAFAHAVDEAGLTFVGPPADAIEIMGDKLAAKELAAKAGVNVVPGHSRPAATALEAAAMADGIGYPVMLKAAAGGGGKGMRIAGSDADVRELFPLASGEAKSSFGDARVFVERYFPNPRHIEVQVLADAHGQCISLGERECSIQRRHQKVFEEAPAPRFEPEARRRMEQQAIALAKAVGYRSAGTVEFIVDSEGEFHFLEMNTRLQVEHPVTEQVTGVDLVEEMLRVAAGEPLRLRQQDVPRSAGWAIEARVYAEDAERGFVPSVGRIRRLTTPPTLAGNGVRIDTGVVEGSEITPHYDPMIAKVITYGKDRQTAVRSMQAALDGFYIRGPRTNVTFLAGVARTERFEQGRLDTGFLDAEYPDGYRPPL
ncbi:MAG: acetyl-CoA carboxylase biotin carboxylase subunit, partial [Rhodospirillales bacterium]|nr:acetyl-CoA carboxylase biotin carboxylase subunit [Rhodospirillales bacterium]